MCGWMAIGLPSLSTDANVSCVVRIPMLRRQRLDAVDDEKGLKIHRLLGPRRAVIVEGGDALGQLALAVATAAVSNALAVVATPLAATVSFRLFLGEAVAFELPFANIVQLSVTGLLLPLLAGMAIRHYAAQWTLRWRARLHGLGLLAIAAVFAAIVANQFETIRD